MPAARPRARGDENGGGGQGEGRARHCVMERHLLFFWMERWMNEKNLRRAFLRKDKTARCQATLGRMAFRLPRETLGSRDRNSCYATAALHTFARDPTSIGSARDTFKVRPLRHAFSNTFLALPGARASRARCRAHDRRHSNRAILAKKKPVFLSPDRVVPDPHVVVPSADP